MRHPRRLFFVLILSLLVMQGCGPGFVSDLAMSTETPTPAPNELVPADSGAAGPLQDVAPASPQLAVGSLYRYFDGALLDAVPNQGPVLMGDGLHPDSPKHQVTVSGFWIYNIEVSNQMYAWCVSVGKCTPPNSADNPNFSSSQFANYPVVGVNWQQAADYCSFVHGRLPTEAEWEKAAGWDPNAKVERLYPWGSKKPNCSLLNFAGCPGGSAPVTQFGAGQSAYGLLNMAGNVFEWTSDWYSSSYYNSSPVQDPQGPQTGSRRVIRSSSYNSDAYLSAVARRFSADPSNHRPDLGFRCVVNDPAYFAPFCTAPVFYGAVIPASASATPAPTKPCPDPVIQAFSGCGQNKTPVNFVTVLNNPPTTVTVTGLEGCDPGNNALGVPHQCKLGVTIHVQASCAVQPAGSAACPPNYMQDPKNPASCIASGAPGACPSGYQYDSKLQCCSVPAGSKAPAPLCAAGEHLYSGMCVDDATGPQPPASLTYVTASGFDCAPNNPGHQCPAGTKYVCSGNGCSCQ